MGLTTANMRAILKENLHNDATFTDPGDLDLFMTLGQRKIVQDSPHTLGTMEATITTDTTNREYSLASKFYQLRAMWHQANGQVIDIIPFEQFMETVEILSSIPSRAPLAACVVGFDSDSASPTQLWRVRFDATPDAVYSIEYWYYFMPQDISTTIISPIARIGFEELLIWASTASALFRNDPEGYATAEGHYQRLLPAYRAFRSDGPARHMVQRPRELGWARSRLPLDPSHYNNG